MKVLFVTVGGSDKPIVTSINKNLPDFVYFLATKDTDTHPGSMHTVDGEGLVCKDTITGEERLSIVSQTQLTKEQYQILLVESDDPYYTYGVAEKEIAKHLSNDDKVIIDYTGGTKSMSVGLATAGMEHHECEISIVTGIRKDLVKVKDGMERITKLPSNSVYIQRQKKLAKKLISQRDYDSAIQVLDELSFQTYIEDEQQFNRIYYLTKAFSLWDKFQYEQASVHIELYKNDEKIKPYNALINKLKNTIKWFDEWKPESKNPPGPGFILVYDLLANAERKASHNLYDDAISRIYRAVEMYEQFCLMTGKIKMNTSNIDVTLLPQEHVEYYESKRNLRNKKIQIGLEEGFRLLKILNHPVGDVWAKWENKLKNELQKRNYSFLAHGNKPLTEKNYQEMKSVVWDFIDECDKAQDFKHGRKDYLQLPTEY